MIPELCITEISYRALKGKTPKALKTRKQFLILHKQVYSRRTNIITILPHLLYILLCGPITREK